MNRLFSDTITVWRAIHGTDKYGNPVTTWSQTEGKTTVTGVSVQVAYSRDATDEDRVLAELGMNIYSRPGVALDVLTSDRILYADLLGVGTTDFYKVVGQVAQVRIGGAVHHTELQVAKAQ